METQLRCGSARHLHYPLPNPYLFRRHSTLLAAEDDVSKEIEVTGVFQAAIEWLRRDVVNIIGSGGR